VNSEELEQSLKTEFESYLKATLAELKQETVDFQQRIEAEFEKQKAQIDEAFRDFSTRFDADRALNAPFHESVGEHLRLARDEGARIAADAMVQAENLGQSPLSAVAAPVVETKYDAIRDAVNDISSKDSQSAILKSLVHHASTFAPRGAFFIIKSEHFSGWKVFGSEEPAESSIRDIHFPVSGSSIIGAAVQAKSPVDGSQEYGGDAAFTRPLGFAESNDAYAIPLMARGRGVAALYVDRGDEGPEAGINRDALETIVRVAGLTVELLASNQTAKAENRTITADFEGVPTKSDSYAAPRPERFEPTYSTREPAADTWGQPAAFEPVASSSFAETEAQTFEPAPPVQDFQQPTPAMPATFEEERQPEPPAYDFQQDRTTFAPEVPSNPFDAERSSFSGFEMPAPAAPEPPQPAAPVKRFEDNPFAEQPYPGDAAVRASELANAFEAPVETFSREAETPQPVDRFEPADMQPRGGDMVFDSAPAFEPSPAPSPMEQPRERFEPATTAPSGFAPQYAEPAVIEAPVVKAPPPRLSERNVDLPIEVPEEERRIHNDARRFARLLVSEIKLYNEKKVTDGRDAGDLYERLREAIDRSREMYDKRVQPPVAAKFDYFHYELVNSLAEGKAERLGRGYPGASI
jgi:hypothetical protein